MTAIESIMPLSDWLERAWLERYLDRQLTEDETNWFETYLMERPDLLKMVEADLDLRDAINASRTAFALNPNTQAGHERAEHKRQNAPLRTERIQPPQRRWLSLAASLLLGIGIGGIAIEKMTTVSTPNVIPNPKRIIYDSFRGESTEPVIQNGGSQSEYVLIEVGVPSNVSEIHLLDNNGKEVTLDATTDGFATFLLKKNQLLHQNEYSVIIKTPGKQNIYHLTPP